MSKRPEPDDVDLFIGGVAPDAEAALETARFIEEYKERPGHPAEVEEAERILAALGVQPSEYGTPDAAALLDHWRECVADLTKPTPEPSKTMRE